MEDRKRFQNQTLNSEDYEKVEEGAKALKHGAKILAAFAFAFGVDRKYGPALRKSLRKIFKL